MIIHAHWRASLLIIHGDADRIAPLESAQWLAETLPNATLQVINGAGHVPIMTRPDEVGQEIHNFHQDVAFTTGYHIDFSNSMAQKVCTRTERQS